MTFWAKKANPQELPGSLWVTRPDVVIDIDPDEIEGLFRVRVGKKKRGPPNPKKSKPLPITLIDPNRALCCGIAMGHIKLPVEDLMKALVACDPRKLAGDDDLDVHPCVELDVIDRVQI